MNHTKAHDQGDWLYPFRKKIIAGVVALMAVSLVATMIFIALMLRRELIRDSAVKTQELTNSIASSLHYLMLVRDPETIQATIDNIGKGNHSVVKAFVLDRGGRIAYSSERAEIGTTIDRYTDRSCTGCHQVSGVVPGRTTIIMEGGGPSIQRIVRVIYNEPACHQCHPPSDHVNGKLVVDRSLRETDALIATVELVIIGAGLACLVLLVPFLSWMLSRGVNRYITEIVRQDAERSLLYMMIDRLSQTIDLKELQLIVVEIVRETFNAQEVDLVMLRDDRAYKVVSWSSASGRIERKNPGADGVLAALIGDWLDGSLVEETISADGKRICIPVVKGERRFALIVVRREGGGHAARTLGLLKAMSGHIAVALENAFLYYIAITDELTRLYTQRHFRNTIDREFQDFERYGRKITLLMVDLDDFKRINDTYGHIAGDSVLRGVAACIRLSIRDNDLGFRYGGEEFAVILPETDRGGGRYVAERVREGIRDMVFHEGGQEIRVTVSVGVATCPDDAQSVRDLIMAADAALYAAKKLGKDRVVVSGEQP